MKKLALIRKENKSQWKSCQSITHNLLLAYRSLVDEDVSIEEFDFSQRAGTFESLMLAERIFSSGATHIIFVDHDPHPQNLIKALAQKYQASIEKPSLVFHLFGDFILQSLSWKNCAVALTSFKVKLLSASAKQSELVKKLLKKGGDSLVVPFPLHIENNPFSSEARHEARNKLGINESYNFIYTGRLSYQKNVIDIINAFAKLREVVTSPVKLIFAGPMDDLGAPYIGKEGIAGTFFYHWEEALKSLPGLLENEEVIYRGNLNSDELSELYLAGDCYISLSAHNDEDYGMSPAEALGYGLPCLLSSWGGFISFKKYFPQQVSLIPLEFGARRHKCRSSSVFKSMLLQLNHPLSDPERITFTKEAEKVIGYKEIGQKIRKIVLSDDAKEFVGFNDTFTKLASVFETSPSAPFRGADGGFSEFYGMLYRDYALENS